MVDPFKASTKVSVRGEQRDIAEFDAVPADPMKRDEATARPEQFDHLASLVQRFSNALLQKLRDSEEKYGWNNGWLKDDWSDDLRRELIRHVDKGDPRDVAAFCAFAWHHGWSVSRPVGGFKNAAEYYRDKSDRLQAERPALLAALDEAKKSLQRAMPFLETRVHGNTEARELYAQIETALSKLNEAVDGK